jgi:hypothetical protein
MDKADVLLTKMFFYGDYLANRTESGEEESGIRLRYNIEEKLTKEEVELLYKLVLAGVKQS